MILLIFVFFCGKLFGEHTLSKEIILGGCHTINFALGDPSHTLYIEVEKNAARVKHISRESSVRNVKESSHDQPC